MPAAIVTFVFRRLIRFLGTLECVTEAARSAAQKSFPFSTIVSVGFHIYMILDKNACVKYDQKDTLQKT